MNRPANFHPEIHVRRYADEYRTRIIDHTTLLSISGRRVESLNGRWRFEIDPYDSLLRARWFAERGTEGRGSERPLDYDWEHWREVEVPSCWNMIAPEWLYYEGTGIYTRTFSYRPHPVRAAASPAAEADEVERAFLRVGAANYESFVFLNGEYLGVHRGGSTPFSVELTSALRPENRLILAVSNRREPDQVPGDNTDWFNYGGVYRGVSLIRVPPCFIRHWSIALVPGSAFRRLRLVVEVEGPPTPRTGRQRAAVQRPLRATLRIPDLGIEQPLSIQGSRGELEIDAAPELWRPESPRLYEAELSLEGGDAVRERVGFREIAREGDRLLLNGEEISVKGVSCHEDSLQNGKAVSSSELASMFDTARDLGCNFIRLAHYPHTEEAARMADERGVLLWEEIPVYWAVDFANEATYADADNQLSELILRDANRASVILWSVGNENPDTDERLAFMSRLAGRARALDPTRLVTAACLWNRETNRIEDRLADHLDVVGINEYFGWYEGSFEDLSRFFAESASDRPVIVSEFGAGARAGSFGTVDDPFTENRQREIYERQIEVIRQAPYVVGMTPWVLFDFRSPRRLNDMQRGFNRKGLVDADRLRRKLAFFTLQEYYRPK